MVNEGYLDSTEKLYFLSHYEIDTLLRFSGHAGNQLLRVAAVRKVVYQKEISWKFPLVSKEGAPKIEKCEISEKEWKGVGIVPGTVSGQVRKCTTSTDVMDFPKGQILIVPQSEMRKKFHFFTNIFRFRCRPSFSFRCYH
jgi:hypothetical protein